MNIFYLDVDPVKAAQFQFNKHVVKMPLETAQLLCSAHHLHPTKEIDHNLLYKITHKNHPSSAWARYSLESYSWLYSHFIALCDEYKLRYKRTHACDRKFRNVLVHPPDLIPKSWKDPPQCMPEAFQCKNAVQAYRSYYKKGKGEFLHEWRYPRKKPEWF